MKIKKIIQDNDVIIEKENTEAVAEEEKVIEPKTHAVAEKVEDEKTDDESVNETTTEEVKDTLQVIDEKQIFQDGFEKAGKEYLNAIKLVDAGLISLKDLTSKEPSELIDNALEKLYGEKIDIADRNSHIKLAVININKKSWNFTDTVSIAKAKEGVFFNNILNNR